MLLQCGLFLRQSGLLEQLWVLLELYLELNLSTAGSEAFKTTVHIPEDEIRETTFLYKVQSIDSFIIFKLLLYNLFTFLEQLEDSIITSGLPLGALWLRIERLREGIYFFPVEESSDPQRMVFREDLAHLLFPITRSCSTRLIMNCLLLLKVPPLPLSGAFYKYARLDNITWSLDSVEIILAANFSKGKRFFFVFFLIPINT